MDKKFNVSGIGELKDLNQTCFLSFCYLYNSFFYFPPVAKSAIKKVYVDPNKLTLLIIWPARLII